MKITLIGILVVFLTGCTVTKPHVLSYRIAPTVSEMKSNEGSCKANSLKVSQAFTSKGLMSKKMHYVETGYKEFTYTESGWSNPPNKAISKSLLASVRGSGLFLSVNSANSRSKSDLYLETTVEEFLQFYNMEDKTSYVEVKFSFTLVDLKNNKIVDSKVISQNITTESLNAEAGVVALNEALSQVLKQTNIWLHKACK